MNVQLSDHFTYKKLLYFCFPPVVMMIFTSIYGVIDGLFVSNFVGKTSFAAVNLVMPFIMILGCFGFMIGTGGSALVAKTLGEGNEEKANRYFTMMVMFTVIIGVTLAAIGILFIRPISYLLGATDAMIEDCVLYGRITFLSLTGFMLQNVFQSFLTAAEKPKLGLAVTVAAGVTNMVLDALFIAGLKWGVMGAALATGIGECLGGILPLIYFLRPNSSLLQLTKTRLEGKILLKACVNGSSELMTSISGSLVSILYNFQLLRFAGENGIAAYGVLMYVQFVFFAIFIGYTIGAGPIIGYHYGAGNSDELKNMLKKSMMLMCIIGVVMMVIAELLAAPLSNIFVGYDMELFEMTQHGFRIFAFSYILIGVNIFASAFFTALNNGLVSAAISFLRTLVFRMCAGLILPVFFQLEGIWWATVIAEVCAMAVSLIFLFAERKKYHYM